MKKKTSYTESEATSLIHATSGDIFINLNTTSITVEIESGDGYAVLSSYTLTGSIPSSPAIEVELLTYKGNAFEAFNDSKYDISGFTGITIGENYTYSNSVTALPAGIYCLVVYAKSSSEEIEGKLHLSRKSVTLNYPLTCLISCLGTSTNYPTNN